MPITTDIGEESSLLRIVDATLDYFGRIDILFNDAFETRGVEADPRLMQPAEIAEVVVILASDASFVITSSVINAFGRCSPLFG